MLTWGRWSNKPWTSALLGLNLPTWDRYNEILQILWWAWTKAGGLHPLLEPSVPIGSKPPLEPLRAAETLCESDHSLQLHHYLQVSALQTMQLPLPKWFPLPLPIPAARSYDTSLYPLQSPALTSRLGWLDLPLGTHFFLYSLSHPM